jgi:cation diffusion facilitator family transporter
MHTHSMERWQHDHAFLGDRHDRHERRTWAVVALTAAMMVAEIIGGHAFGSMALVADGWHMSTHAAALGIAGLAYLFARRHKQDARFSLGTGKFGDLAAFASAIILGMIAVAIAYESVLRLRAPTPIDFPEAIAIAVIGLAVNLASAWLLRGEHGHGHAHGHAHGHDHGHAHADHHHHKHGADLNLRAAYVHVLADALTSVLAIVGLIAAWSLGWLWIDAAVALVGTVVILSWSIGLIRSAGAVLLDAVPDAKLAGLVRERMEIGGDKVSDLHLWQVGPGHAAVIVSVVSDAPQAPSVYKQRLRDVGGLSHVTVEVHRCEG